MKNLLLVVQIVVSALLTGLILLQGKSSGLTESFTGGGFHYAKRGAEQVVFWLTIALGLIFLAISILNFHF
jgi:protein translocase SecG subunit